MRWCLYASAEQLCNCYHSPVQTGEFSRNPAVEYIEKPKRLYFALDQARTASCVNRVQTGMFDLFGEGIWVACIDSGIDYSHPDFLNSDGTTRIQYLWDQTIPGNPPAGYSLGTEYTKEDIDRALRAGDTGRKAGDRSEQRYKRTRDFGYGDCRRKRHGKPRHLPGSGAEERIARGKTRIT